jgi:hypothetical protein
VDALEPFCPRSPLEDDRILGEWEVVYASKPQTAGGPFRTPLGRTAFPGQRILQIIEAPNVCINQVSYKALGFIPGQARQEGIIEPLDARTFQLTFPALDGKKGGPRRRVIQVGYLDDRVRVARFIPEDEAEEGSFYVFQRTDLEEEEEDEEAAAPAAKAQPKAKQPKYVYADEEEPVPEPAAKKRTGAFGTQIFGKKAGMATQAERSYNKGRPAPPPPAPKRPTSGTARVSVEDQRSARAAAEERRAAERQAAEEDRRAAREAAAAAKAAAEEERRAARAAAEETKRQAAAAAAAAREELAAAKAAAKEQFETLREVATASASEAREAAAAVKEGERSFAALARQAAQSQSKVDGAARVVEALVGQLKEAQGDEKVLEKEVLGLQKTVNELEKRARQSLSLLAGKR